MSEVAMLGEASSNSVGVEYIPLDHSGGRFVDPFQTYAGAELAPVVPLNTITGIDQLEAVMVRHGEPVEIEPVHHFADGVYAREITIPAGTLLTGKIHRTEHLNIISKGAISVWTEGEGVKHIAAPFTFIAPPGTRRLGFAHEDTVWTTIHATRETDLEKLETLLIEPHVVAAIDDGDGAGVIALLLGEAMQGEES